MPPGEPGGKLSRLHLDYMQVSEAGLDHLKDLTGLTYLRLTGTLVTDSGLKKIAGLKKLRTPAVAATPAAACPGGKGTGR
jgi:hypothetical protein